MPSGAQVSCRLAPVPPPPLANSPEPLAFPRPVLYLRRLLTELFGNQAKLRGRLLTPLMVEAVGRLKRLGVGWSSLCCSWPPASEMSLPRTWGWRWSRNRGLVINAMITSKCKNQQCSIYSAHKVRAVFFLFMIMQEKALFCGCVHIPNTLLFWSAVSMVKNASCCKNILSYVHLCILCSMCIMHIMRYRILWFVL